MAAKAEKTEGRPLEPVTAAHLILRHYHHANDSNDVQVPFTRLCDLCMIYAGHSFNVTGEDPFPGSRIYVTDKGPRYRELTLGNFKKESLSADADSNSFPVAMHRDGLRRLTRVFMAFGFASEAVLDDMFRGKSSMCQNMEIGDRARIEDIAFYVQAYGEAMQGDIVVN